MGNSAKRRPAAKAKVKPKPKKPASKQRTTAKQPAITADPLVETAERLGRKAATVMVLEGEDPNPSDDMLREWADSWFYNMGAFDGFPGDVPVDARPRLTGIFKDAFIATMRSRLTS